MSIFIHQRLGRFRVIIVAAIVTTLGSISSHATSADNSARFAKFAKGQISTTISGKLSPKQNEHWYRFEAASGQYAIINLAPLSGKANANYETANVGILHMPNGSQDGTKGGIIYQGCLPVSGKYRLRIARNLMATQGGIAGYNAEIIILPKYASQELCP